MNIAYILRPDRKAVMVLTYLMFPCQQFDHPPQQGPQMAALWSRTGGNSTVEFRQEDTVLVTHVTSPVSMKQPHTIVSLVVNCQFILMKCCIYVY